MVPLRSEAFSDSSIASPVLSRPKLRLVTIGDDEGLETFKPKETASRRRRTSRDQFWFVVVVATLLVAGVSLMTSHVIRAITQSSWVGAMHRPYIVGVVVKPGDNLWKYARRYGAPGNYILDKVDSIAMENNINPTLPLIPGQHLRIKIDNPALLASLHVERRLASTATGRVLRDN